MAYNNCLQLQYIVYMCKTVDYCSGDMLNFNFLEKGLGLVSLSHIKYDFSRKLFLIVSHLLND